MKLEMLGFDLWFEDQFKESIFSSLEPARVCTVDKDNFLVIGKHGTMQAQTTGKLRFETDSSINYPTVGDWACVEYFNNYSLAIIHGILDRKTLLKRKSAGNKIEYQSMGANIDFACIMQSLDADFNIARLERYMVAAIEAKITPIILLSKSDLITAEELNNKITAVKTHYPSHQIISFSNKTNENIEQVENIFLPARTYCIIGSSGVGKTSLLNNLLENKKFATQELRKHDHGGKHTTTRRQMIILSNGALFIDTPGMRELGLISADTGMHEVFSDIKVFAKQCRFPDCSHTHEPGCAVQKAIQSGEISQKHFNNYIKLLKEQAHYSRSYVERRIKDKKFGKMVKSVLKEKEKQKKRL